MIKTISDTLQLSYAYLQIGDRRWNLVKEAVTITPRAHPIMFSSQLTPPPSSPPGILSLPVFFDLNCNGARLEIHKLESIYLSKPSRVSLLFPAGKKIGDGGSLPMEIIVKYPVEHDIQGKVEGIFLKEISMEPSLPSRFILKSGHPITSLPIRIKCKRSIPPGRYPFSLIVSVGNQRIAFLSNELNKPFRWLHLGPLSEEDLANRSPLSFQNELLKTHRVESGRTLRWREVPDNALDNEGRFRPETIYGENRNRCFLLYTAFSMPYEKEASWRIDTKADFNLWLNSELITPEGSGGQTKRGSVKLRKGINTILISACCEERWNNIGLRIGDENLLPLFGMNNDIDKLIDGFEAISQEQSDFAGRSGRMRKVTFTLNYPDAASVSVIGTFNNWDPDANPMKKDQDGIWKTTIYLAPGKYSYKFIVNRKTKITDPTSKQVESDGFGGFNSVIIVH